MSTGEKAAAGIGSFDVISTTEEFAAANPEALATFMEVTEAANAAFTGSAEQIAIIAADAGMDAETTANQMAGFMFPTADEQKSDYCGADGIAAAAAASLGLVFSDDTDAGQLAQTIDCSYL